jgi:hypothetical protein
MTFNTEDFVSVAKPTRDVLADATANLGAVETGPGKYAFKPLSDAYCDAMGVLRAPYFIVSIEELSKYDPLAIHNDEGRVVDPYDKWVHAATLVEVKPPWWAPKYPFGLRNKTGLISAIYPSLESALAGMISGDTLVTVDLSTGEEVAA